MADNIRKKIVPVKKEVPVSDRQRQYALSVLLRSKVAFTSVYKQVTPDMFTQDDNTGYSIIWAAAQEYYDKFQDLPLSEALMADVESRLALVDDLSEDALQDLNEFFDSTFSLPAEQLSVQVAMSYVSRMLKERAQHSLLAEIQSGVVTDLTDLLQQHTRQADAASAVLSGKAPLPFPDKPEDIKPLVIEPTGVGFLDAYMDGGMARREVNGFCGPYGSCKTTLGVKLAVEKARSCIRAWREKGSTGIPERVYFISWEEDLEQLSPRFLAYAGHIHMSSLRGKDFLKGLSKSVVSSLKPYEKDFYKDQITANVVQGEYDRMTYAMSELNMSLRILDFSGANADYRQPSGQMVDGIVAAITRDQQLDNNPGVALVIVDYAGAAAERAIATGYAKRDDLRHLVGKMPLNLKNMVAAPFNCQVWCLHQLGTEANSRNAGFAPKSTDTAEAKNFFENVNFGFMVGKPNKDNMTVLTNGKQRRAARKEDIVVQIQGQFSDVIDMSRRFMISDNSIVSKAEAHQIVRPLMRDLKPLDNDTDIGVD